MVPWEGELDDLQKVESGLTAWEIDFIDSMDRLRGRSLSDRQIETLHKIWDKRLWLTTLILCCAIRTMMTIGSTKAPVPDAASKRIGLTVNGVVAKATWNTWSAPTHGARIAHRKRTI